MLLHSTSLYLSVPSPEFHTWKVAVSSVPASALIVMLCVLTAITGTGGGGPSLTIIACDLKSNHKEGRNVLHLQGSVAWRTEAAFQSELAQPHNAAFAAALKKAEGP